jgi:SAM-dependent methyltransferase
VGEPGGGAQGADARGRRVAEVRALAAVALGTAALLLAEIIVAKQANFALSDAATLYMPLIIYGGLALGGLGAAAPWTAAWPRGWALAAAGAALSVAFLGLARWPGAGPLWAALPFVAFGWWLCRTMSEVALPSMVWALGLGGVATYAAVDGLARLGPALLVVDVALCALAVAAGGAPRAGRRRDALVGASAAVVVVLLAAGLLAAGILEAPSYLERTNASFRGATRLLPPRYSALFRTDVLRDARGRVALVTNGSRFAPLPPASVVRRTLAGEVPGAFPSAAPYLVRPAGRVLVIGSAGGWDALAALGAGAESVVAVNVNPDVFRLMKDDLAAESAALYADPRIELVVAEGRRYLETTARTFDVVTLHGVQTGTSADLLSTVFLDSHLFTEEALAAVWKRVAPGGVAFFDEYERWRDEGRAGVTLIGILGRAAVRVLGLAEPDRHCFYYRYGRGDDRPREGLLLTKDALDDARAGALRAALVAAGATPVPGGCGGVPAEPGALVDDRPFFAQSYLWRAVHALPPWAVALAGALLAAACWLAARRSQAGVRALALVLTGGGYSVLVLAFTSPASLLLGEPSLATPVVLAALYGGGLGGGLLALRVSRRAILASLGALAAYLTGLGAALPFIRHRVLGVEALALRAALVAALILPAAVLAQIPYVHLLGEVEGGARGRAWVWENAGALAGLAAGFAVNVAAGTTASLWASGAAYLLALAVLAGRPPR